MNDKFFELLKSYEVTWTPHDEETTKFVITKYSDRTTKEFIVPYKADELALNNELLQSVVIELLESFNKV